MKPSIFTIQDLKGEPWPTCGIAVEWSEKPIFPKQQTWGQPRRPTSAALCYCYSGSLSPVDILREAFEAIAIHLVQILPLDIWAWFFLVETQDWVFQGELALWWFTAVVDEEPAFDPWAQIHLPALLWSADVNRPKKVATPEEWQLLGVC